MKKSFLVGMFHRNYTSAMKIVRRRELQNKAEMDLLRKADTKSNDKKDFLKKNP